MPEPSLIQATECWFLTPLTQCTLTAAQFSAMAKWFRCRCLEENGFKPDFEAIEAEGVKMMFLNYPNNPTAATVDKRFLEGGG